MIPSLVSSIWNVLLFLVDFKIIFFIFCVYKLFFNIHILCKNGKQYLRRVITKILQE